MQSTKSDERTGCDMAKKKTETKSTARTTSKNEHKKANYDRLEIVLPLGWKDRLKDISSTMGISVNEYVTRLIKADIDQDHKHDDMVSMLNKWEVKEKYHPMIQDASFLPTTGYYIKLKKGFINDHFESDEILCRTTKELRHIMQFTHPVRTVDEMCGFDSKTYEQLLRWQVPRPHFQDIEGVGDHEIRFKDGTVWNFKSVNELRYMWKTKRPLRN